MRLLAKIWLAALASSMVLGTIACGGSVSEDATDGGLDGGIDGGIDGSIDVTPDSAREDVALEAKPPFDASTTCPATVPATKTDCGPIHFTCSYKGACGDDFAQCVDGTWTVITSSCSPEYCPTAGPLPGGSCLTEGFACEYPKAADAGLAFDRCSVCTCKSGAFVCEDHPIAECPLPTCKTGDACSTPHLIGCEYGGKCGTSCRCGDDDKLSCPSRPC